MNGRIGSRWVQGLWLTAALAVPGRSLCAEGVPPLQSPDGRVRVEAALKDGPPRWSLSFNGRPVIAAGRRSPGA